MSERPEWDSCLFVCFFLPNGVLLYSFKFMILLPQLLELGIPSMCHYSGLGVEWLMIFCGACCSPS